MNAEVIRVSKKKRPLRPEIVIRDIQKNFPHLECQKSDRDGRRLVVKKSPFAGAMIDVGPDRLKLEAKVPAPYARALDLALLGTITAATGPKMVKQLKSFFRRRYAG